VPRGMLLGYIVSQRGIVVGVFWYTKHVHYTLIWICL
jgi:hypothetical protein